MKATISERRINNIRAFPGINWEDISIHNPGLWGDRPQYELKGNYGPFKIIYKTASPAGSEPYLKIMDSFGRKIRSFRPAPQKLGKAIIKQLRQLAGQAEIQITQIRKMG
jgi:hypothetical protein